MLGSTRKLLLLVSIVGFVQAEKSNTGITEIYTMSEAQTILDSADECTLVLYDVDETLIMPTDKIHVPKFFSVNPGKALKDVFNQKMGNRIENIWSNVLLQAHRKLIEPDIVTTIRALQDKKVTVLGLTKMRTGRFGKIASLAQYRSNQLEKLGIHFDISYDQAISFDQFIGEYEGFPLVYRGIIMTNDLDKGMVLNAFIDHLDYTPTQVIFFDDVLENVISVYDAMSQRGIKCSGYHYKAVEQIQGELDVTTAQFQLDYLSEHGIWLNEEAARLAMVFGVRDPLMSIQHGKG